jgi:murein L,D-transpeptidase YcbB/YkuD
VEGPLGIRGPQWVVLREPLPVYIVYFTAYVEDDGEVRFLDDLYGYDSRMYARLGLGPSA